MNSITKKTMLKGFVVTTFAVISLQSMAFAAASKPSLPVADVKYALVQDAGKNISKDSKAAPIQVAGRTSIGTNRNPCDIDPLHCGG
ncbi:hypothetical protein ACA40_10390 [Pseudomonas syringae pv. lapsa]|uniref:hypothetical protein n=1 Tax=Pseudomonas syringae TaxID=317 RepID=UPI00070FD59B|nr:hypothetical protein [Pseudomonas syringae]ALU60249.1 hypothetical protein ACA40_10390 [Pseudomonas syringae pv. lapsa]